MSSFDPKENKLIAKQMILGKEFRVFGNFEEPLFLAGDIAKWIEHSDVEVMCRMLDDDEIKIKKIDPIVQSTEGLQVNTNYTFVTEMGAYRILMRSNKPLAKPFQKEVAKIIKEIRIKGYYIQEGREEEALKHLKKLRSESANVQKMLNGLFTYAVDYEKSSDDIRRFYASMQNKLYQAICDMTAKELIFHRADHTKDNMGLTTHTGKYGPIKRDIEIGKNYLSKDEFDLLIILVNIMIDTVYAKIKMSQEITIQKLINVFNTNLQSLADKKLTGRGKIEKADALTHALNEYNLYKNKSIVGGK